MKVLLWVCVVGIVPAIYAANTTVNMQIIPDSVSIWAPTAFSFSSTIAASNAVQTLEQNFWGGNYFYVQDLKWADAGWSTTLQLAGPLTAWSSTIPAANVSFKASGSWAVLLWGTANSRVTLAAWATAYQDLSSARTLMVRNNTANNWVISKYGTEIYLKVSVPARQAVGSYTTSLVFTLIEN